MSGPQFPPPFHIGFNLEEIPQVNAPWPARRCLQHEAPEFRMKGREYFAATEETANVSKSFPGGIDLQLTVWTSSKAPFLQPSTSLHPGPAT